MANELKPTKRNILRTLSSFYDPIGLIQPILISVKILMQKICEKKLEWDVIIDDDLRDCWSNILDNGTNFVSNETQSFIANLRINWHFDLPLAPWHGVFFERLVRSAKDLLKKSLRNSKLTFEEMQTILCEIELILNNRQLSYGTPTEFEACLTPNHLLFGHNLNICTTQTTNISCQEFDIVEKSSKINKIVAHFWNRWRKEYVVNLRESHRPLPVKRKGPSLMLNDVVLIHDEKIPKHLWEIGKVQEIYKGCDNQIRGALVRT